MTDADDSTRFETRLLADLIAAQKTIEPHDAPVAVHTRTRALRLGLAAVVALGALGALLGFVVFNGGQGKASAAEIKSRTLAAVASADALILHEQQTETSYGFGPLGPTTETIHSDVWQDLAANRTRDVTYASDGLPRSELVSTHTGKTVQLELVNYTTHAWTTATGKLPIPFPTPSGGSQAYARQIEDELNSGEFALLGAETVDGHLTLHLSRAMPQPRLPANAPSNFKPPTRLDMWIDPSSYLPVREEATTNTGHVVAQTDFEWLPRTPANLANLNLVVPPGFTHETEQMKTRTSGNGTYWGTVPIP